MDTYNILKEINQRFNNNGVIHDGIHKQVLFRCKNDTEFKQIVNCINRDINFYLKYNEQLIKENLYLDIDLYFRNKKIFIKIKKGF